MLRISRLTSSRRDAPSRRCPLHRLDDPRRRGDPDVRGDQDLLERIEGLDIHRPTAPVRRVGPVHDLVETVDELLRGPRQGLLDLVENTHGFFVLPLVIRTDDGDRASGR